MKISLILAFSLISIYGNKTFAQDNTYQLGTPLVFEFPVKFTTTGIAKIKIYKRDLSRKITDIVDDVTLVENINKVGDKTLSFSVTDEDGNVFDNVQCSLSVSLYTTEATDRMAPDKKLGFYCHFMQVHFKKCESDEVVLANNNITILARHLNRFYLKQIIHSGEYNECLQRPPNDYYSTD